MTTTQTLPKPTPATSGGDDKPTLHTYCGACYPLPKPGIALCGHKSQGGPAFDADRVPVEFPLCVVCEDLVPAGCPKCGAGR